MDAVIYVKQIEEISIEQVNASLNLNGYVIVRGLYCKDELRASVAQLKASFSANNDAPTVGETPKDVQLNFQKLLIGGKTQSKDYLARFFRVFYNPTWDKDIYQMRTHFESLIAVRNRLMQVSQDFAMNKIEPCGLWSACRLHQYPCGGAFMSKHRDYIVDGHLKARKLDFYQLLLNLSEKGTDYQTGGAYVYNDGLKINLDDVAQIGDIIIYDGHSLHGVEEVDPDKKLELNAICGRIVAFATLYNDKSEQNKISDINDEVKYDITSKA